MLLKFPGTCIIIKEAKIIIRGGDYETEGWQT